MKLESNIEAITDEFLEEIGFKCEQDNGHSCVFRKDNIVICADSSGFVDDSTGDILQYKYQIMELINKIHKSVWNYGEL